MVCSPVDMLGSGLVLDFINQFKSNKGGAYHNPKLSNLVAQHPAFQNYVERFTSRLNSQLKITNGSLSGVYVDMGDVRPIFNSDYDRFNGFQILINDTESTNIELLNYNYNSTLKTWQATILVEITDHFGLDKNDVLTYQGEHSGFAAWWRLQHRKCYIPLVTKIYIQQEINGKL